MMYEATWNDISGRLVIKEDGIIIHEGRAADVPTAGAEVREQGFGFTDVWMKVPNTSEWQAPLKAVELE